MVSGCKGGSAANAEEASPVGRFKIINFSKNEFAIFKTLLEENEYVYNG